jgi:hypothetical protein
MGILNIYIYPNAAIFIRGLAEAFARNPSNTNLRILLHSYTDVQVGDFGVKIFGHLFNIIYY